MRIIESSIKIENTEIDYISFGKGENTLLLIPGLGLKDVKGSGFAIAYMYRDFAKAYKVYCIDRKRVIPDNYSVEAIAQDIAFAMRSLHIEGACVLGISQGGMIGQYLAINYPTLVKKLVIAVSLSRNNEIVINCVNNWIQMAENNNFKELSIDILTKMYSDSYILKYKWLFPILSRVSKPKDSGRFISLAKAALSCDTYDRLNEIECPVFVIGGAKDKVVTGNASLEIANRLGCEIYMYENLGHSAYDEAKDFNARVLNFFDRD
jgi:Predicted hydrolases or acyltransferases (alpha/beta hydrolase superfamily)